ncbi:ECF-type sigma factor [Acanthopleuribacter pedis]|uniref:RNA polymerase sigma-70 ECF-like HTH domain-containing protein n=1 Tax=Acanthopleuribacter pedis TaxID=442870 RepID=A0A8J7QEY8_9BACT|nr:ECF-type sigma factor [Acanthopleuribacter pedis]MBO1317239.1 hypothetical protein [Acanthopleuribacter pedis]MBO1318545.1 hypothetical protein [Acanthopleuribacter pedis]
MTQSTPSPDNQPGPVTRLLNHWQQGCPEALSQLIPLVYDDLRRMANAHLYGENRSALQPTALINELYLRLQQAAHYDIQDRTDFFRFSSALMRRILVDEARYRCAAKRGHGKPMQSIDDPNFFKLANGETVQPETLLSIDEGLRALQKRHQRAAKVLEMRFFAGFTVKEIAKILDVSRACVLRDWQLARQYLEPRLSPGDPNAEEKQSA